MGVTLFMSLTSYNHLQSTMSIHPQVFFSASLWPMQRCGRPEGLGKLLWYGRNPNLYKKLRTITPFEEDLMFNATLPASRCVDSKLCKSPETLQATPDVVFNPFFL